MNAFEVIKKELSELVGLVRESERYCVTVASRPDLATAETHALELGRERRIAELSARYGITT
ncbi:hypothetical protein FRC97_00215 (plasmid) [Paracidovorax citrulli]|nr:hypothetical protein [Paracidovorax citrulli]QCX13185.1 hypothetical protein APS58_p00041 [Paracidovorax citrulli]UMT93560.1 hypothetical protein FRC97_00215 [Paracidovorax citrulli]